MLSTYVQVLDKAAHEVGVETSTPRSMRLPEQEMKAFFAQLAHSHSQDKLDAIQVCRDPLVLILYHKEGM